MLRKFFISIFLSRFKLPRDVHRYAFSKFSSRTLLQTEDSAFTYGELADRSFRLAQAWNALGLKKGDVVFTQTGSVNESFELRTASLETGVLVVSFNASHSIEVIVHALKKVNPKLFVLDPLYGKKTEQGLRSANPLLLIWKTGEQSQYEDILAENESRQAENVIHPSDPLALGFTSGTTGEPKWVVSGHGAAIASLKLLAKNMERQTGKNAKDINLSAIPLAGAGSGLIMPTLLSGGILVTLSEYSPERLVATIKKHAVTRLFLTPSQLIDLLEMPKEIDVDLTSLIHVVYGTAPMPAAKLEEALLRFGSIFQQGYGQAEILPPVSILKSLDHMKKGVINNRKTLSSCGRVVDGVEVRIVDPNKQELPIGSFGEVHVKTPTQFQTYLDPSQNEGVIFEDGFFRTGDHGYIDKEGYLHILDRQADLIPTDKGIIYPRLVEEEAHNHPAVRECCLVASKGEPVLCVSIRQAFIGNDKTEIKDEILALLISRIAAWQMPQQILFVHEMPRSVLGKVLRREVRENIMATLATE